MLCQLSYSGKYSYIIFTSPIVVNTFFKTFLIFFEETLMACGNSPAGEGEPGRAVSVMIVKGFQVVVVRWFYWPVCII